MIKLNDFQKKFFQALAKIQHEVVQIGLIEYAQITDKEKLFKNITYDVIYEIMELIDGYNDKFKDKIILVDKDFSNIKENPKIQLHDAIVDHLKTE